MLCVIEIYSQFAWVIPLKDKKGIKITNALQKILDEFNRKPNKIWADKGSQYWKKSMKVWLEKNGIEMYSAHNKRKSVVTERIIRILKTKMFKYMTSILKKCVFESICPYH